MRKFFTKKKIIAGLVIIVLIIIGFVVFGNNNGGQSMVTVERGEVVQEVVITGKTKAQDEVELGFDQNGRILASYVEVGERVEKGQLIAELDSSETLADLEREKAILAEEMVNLEEIKKNGPASLREAEENLASAVWEGYSAADNAVRNKADQFFKTPRTNPSFEIKITDGNFVHYFNVQADLVIELNNGRREVEETLNAWQKELSKTNADRAIADMNQVSSFLDKAAIAVNSFTPADYDYETTVINYKTAIDSARSTVASARAKIISAQENLSSSPVLGTSGVSSVASQEAKINQIKSSISSIEASLRKSRIVAPFGGVVSMEEADPGKTATPGQSVVTLISEQMYIEANVSEINIGKIEVGDTVRAEFDAYPGEFFSGKVSFIDPGETIIDEVVNYKLRIDFDSASEIAKKIKSGLTANIEIETLRKEDALTLPSYAIMKEGEKSFVMKQVGGKPVKTEIMVGLIGSDGKAEILSGLSESDTILINE